MSTATHQAINAVWRLEQPRLLGGLVRTVGDLDLAEDLAQEALLAALERWPTEGIPRNPAAWLMTAARNRGIDVLRRQAVWRRKQSLLGTETDAEAAWMAALAQPFRDDEADRLRLFFVACHPVLSREARVALALRLLGGLTTDEIARAFLLPEPTIAQRIVRAKKTLAASKAQFEVPTGPALGERLPAVLEAIYLVFNEGYYASRGEALLRPALCEDALQLGRVLSAHLPGEAEVHGLIALMELQASRGQARFDAAGQSVLLLEQDRSRWDWLLVERGLAAFGRSVALARPLGYYALQAGIAACHARARRAEDTDWSSIVALYDALVALTGSPVVELNRAMAVAMAFGAEEGLQLVEQLASEGQLARYPLLEAARGDLLARLGRVEAAAAAFREAATLSSNEAERSTLLRRAAGCVAAAVA